MCNSFLDFCEEMETANEKFDLSVLDGFGDGEITLYHASPLKLTSIEPNSWNMGNRLSPKKRKSSFWTNNMKYAILWALDWVILRVDDLPYIHDIEEYKFIVPDTKLRENIGGGISALWPIKEWMKTQVNEKPIYIYQTTVSRAIVSKGQYNIDEYTIDVPITPEKTYIVKPDQLDDVVVTLPANKFNALWKTKIGDTKKRNPNLRERLIFKNPDRVSRQRRRLYNKEYKQYGHADTSQN